jgi:hypothetical protein
MGVGERLLRFVGVSPMCVTSDNRQSQYRGSAHRQEAAVKQVQIQRPQQPRVPAPLDLRTPSGRPLPF